MRSLFIITFFLFFSCKNSQPSSSNVKLVNNFSFQMVEGEQQIANSTEQQVYFKHFSKDSLQIPLFKTIKAKNYLIFIGLPFNSSIEEMSTLLPKNSCSFESDETSIYQMCESEKSSTAEFAKQLDENTLIYISHLSLNETKPFDKEYFESRILTNNAN